LAGQGCIWQDTAYTPMCSMHTRKRRSQ
jgi:hypothetical protein